MDTDQKNQWPSKIRVQESVKICVETRSAPASLAAIHRAFTFYVAHPIRSIHLWLSAFAFFDRSPKIAVPTRTSVAPSSTATA